MAYITSRRFTPRKNVVTEVKVYSNCGQVELNVNGRSLGTLKADDVRICRWTKIQLAPGTNQVEVTGRVGGKEVRDACQWVVEAASTP